MPVVGAEEYKPTTVQELVRVLQKFVSDNESSRSVENRWLCAVLKPFYESACEVGNIRLSEENRKDVNAFRAVELEKEIDRKRKDMEALERDLKKVRAA